MKICFANGYLNDWAHDWKNRLGWCKPISIITIIIYSQLRFICLPLVTSMEWNFFASRITNGIVIDLF